MGSVERMLDEAAYAFVKANSGGLNVPRDCCTPALVSGIRAALKSTGADLTLLAGLKTDRSIIVARAKDLPLGFPGCRDVAWVKRFRATTGCTLRAAIDEHDRLLGL